MSRRTFIGGLLGAGVLAIGGRGLTAGSDGKQAPIRFFEVVHEPGYYVTMTNGERFAVTVKEQGSGVVLEHHEGVSATTLLALDSAFVQIVERN